jgi:hypothetical protein
MGKHKSLRPTNRVNVGSSSDSGQVCHVGKKKQGGAWVRTYMVRLDNSDAIRTVGNQLVRPRPPKE